jgi:hypothetical protein
MMRLFLYHAKSEDRGISDSCQGRACWLSPDELRRAKGPSFVLRWWTLSQRIRTFSEIPIEAAILDTAPAPVYQQIAPKAVQLQQLGMSNSAIARRLGVTDRTVAKAIAWLGRVEE